MGWWDRLCSQLSETRARRVRLRANALRAWLRAVQWAAARNHARNVVGLQPANTLLQLAISTFLSRWRITTVDRADLPLDTPFFIFEFSYEVPKIWVPNANFPIPASMKSYNSHNHNTRTIMSGTLNALNEVICFCTTVLVKWKKVV